MIKEVKYTCDCCGYMTLLSNEVGEICPVCFWEEDYYHYDINNAFDISGANHISCKSLNLI